MKIFFRISTVLLLLFLGFGGIYGGLMLITEPSGKNFLWTVELLDGTPFKDFLLPGIILLIINGLLPLFIAILTLLEAKNYYWWIIAQGVILIGWLTAEIMFSLDLFSPITHYPSYGVGIILVLLGLLLFRKQKRQL